jgi:general secretion pathway protein K
MAMNTARRTRQRGAALLVAMIIVTLVATLAAGMIWQQWRAVQVEAAERARVESGWVLTGALDWARLILRTDKRDTDTLSDVWATPLAEARLSTFLAADKTNADEEGPEAFLSGSITDAQSRYNLRNLVDAGKPVPAEIAGAKRLFQVVGLAPSIVDTIANGINDALPQAGPASAPRAAAVPLMPQSVEQLAWLGVDADSIERMKPYVVLLPIRTPVNVNTAGKEVLVAAIDGLDIGTAERMVQARQSQPFKDMNDLKRVVPATLQIVQTRADVRSSFFEVRGRMRLEDRVLEESSLVERRGNDVIPLNRKRESSRENAE